MPSDGANVITRYFEADARRDVTAMVGLFADDAVVVDEGASHEGAGAIRAWREGTASKYEYTTEVVDIDRTGDDSYLVTGRLEGNFPGGTATLKWRFLLDGDRIRSLQIAP
jgi:uncharacterized protein (TIGR02246 family)